MGFRGFLELCAFDFPFLVVGLGVERISSASDSILSTSSVPYSTEVTGSGGSAGFIAVILGRKTNSGLLLSVGVGCLDMKETLYTYNVF